MTPLQRITKRVNRHGDINVRSTPRPLLTLAEFFEGNNVIGSIGCNLFPTPKPTEFYHVFQSIAARHDVIDVRVQVTMFDAPEWPFSDMVWVVTSATADQVIEWFDRQFRPDKCREGWLNTIPIEYCPVPLNMRPIACWWD